MTQEQMIIAITAFPVCVLFVGAGIVLLLVNHLRKKRCSVAVNGIVAGYKTQRFNKNRHLLDLPVVEYFVDGLAYEGCLKYASVNYIFSPFVKQPGVQGDILATTLRVAYKTGLAVNRRVRLEEYFPLGSTLKVYYNPKKPQQNYVERYTGFLKLMGIIFLCLGFGLFMMTSFIILFAV